ncbi:MAG: hypothetical protein J0H81_04700 [Sphingopyxis terrae]|nr:hypothetical protein [Sphingopyxis terrae]
MLDMATWLAGEGYSVLSIDMRGHGQSSPQSKSFGYLEARDAHAALAWLRQQHPASKLAPPQGLFARQRFYGQKWNRALGEASCRAWVKYTQPSRVPARTGCQVLRRARRRRGSQAR